MSAGFITKERILEAANRLISSSGPLLEKAKVEFGEDSKKWFAAHPGHECRSYTFDFGCEQYSKTIDRAKKIHRLASLCDGEILLSEDDLLFLFGMGGKS